MKAEILGVRIQKQKKELFERVCVELNTTPSIVTRQLIDLYLRSAPKLIEKHRKELRTLQEFVTEVENHPDYCEDN